MIPRWAAAVAAVLFVIGGAVSGANGRADLGWYRAGVGLGILLALVAVADRRLEGRGRG